MSMYEAQNARSAHAAYWLKTDPTSLQKIATISSYFLLRDGARLADMGCGWGEGSYHLAECNPHIYVTGIDIDPARIAHAKELYGKPLNLNYDIGNIENPEQGVYDGFLNSSVLHHVYSYNNYQLSYVERTLQNQYEALKENGLLVVRDFLAWPEDRFVTLDLPNQTMGRGIEGMSSADLLILFAHTARFLSARVDRGFFIDERESNIPGWRRFYLQANWAAEFLLRKDYRKAWNGEVQEVYGFWQRHDYMRELSRLGGRVVYMGPFYNKWIVKNRFMGHAVLRDESGQIIDFPPTNFIAIVEKRAPSSSHFLKERIISRTPQSYLVTKSYRNMSTGELHDVANRPGSVVDYLPYFLRHGTLYVAAKYGYPRPITNIAPRGTVALDGKHFSGHLIEPIALANVANDGDINRALIEKAGLGSDHILLKRNALTYYPSATLLDEQVRSVFVKLNKRALGDHPFELHKPDPALSGFSTSGEVRLFRAQDILRSAQVGILPEARLELNVYALMQKLGIVPNNWLDGKVELPSLSCIPVTKAATLLSKTPLQQFEEIVHEQKNIELIRSTFEERSSLTRLALKVFEFTLSLKGSTNKAVILPLVKNQAGEIFMGIQEMELPCPQMKEGGACYYALPSYRMPKDVTSLYDMTSYLSGSLACQRDMIEPLGEGFYSSIGVTPDKVYPYLFMMNRESLRPDYFYVQLQDFFCHMEKWRDAPLMISAYRAIHATGKWEACAAAYKAHRSTIERRPFLQAPAIG